MATTITLNITDSNGTKLKTAKLLGDASCIKSIFPNFEDNKVTSEQFAMLQQISNKAGVAGVLEIEDLEPLQQAEYYGFNEYYDIEQTEKNGKAFYKITIKETPFYYPDPKAQNIVEVILIIHKMFRTSCPILSKKSKKGDFLYQTVEP